MAKLTWLGSTEGYREGETPLDSCMWNGVLFTAGDRVEVTDEWMINKARGNRFFRVEENTPPQSPQPEPPLPIGLIRPETWTNTPPAPFPDFPASAREDGRLVRPDDYPPEDELDRQPPKRRGRPPRIRDNGDGDH